MVATTASPIAQPAAPDREPYARDLAELVSGMSKFLTLLVSAPPFTDAKIGLAEWSVLNIVGKASSTGQKQVAGVLGISGQRVSQIIDSLLRAGLVSASASEIDARQKVVVITGAGTAKLTEVNQALEAMLAVPLKSNPRILTSASRIVNRHLLRAVRRPKTPAEVVATQGTQPKKASSE